MYNADASPTPPSRNKSSQYRLSRKSLSSIAAAAAKSAQTDDASDADDAAVPANGGTVKTLYATPYSTLNNKQKLSSSPPTASDVVSSKTDGAAGGAGGSGFLSNWMRSKSKATAAQSGKGHTKRQSIKSIEVFQASDQEEDSDISDSAAGRFAFPSSSTRRKSGLAHNTPPRNVLSAASTARDRQRVDSTMSLNAPSVYHTPRGSTFFSVSPTPRTTLGVPSRKSGQTGDDGSVKHLSVAGSSSSLQSDEQSRSERGGGGGGAGLKHKPSIASSSLSVATVKPTQQPGQSTLKAPKSINDLFQPQPSPPASPPAPQTPSTISLPIDTPAPVPPTSSGDIEQGFTLFYTSAKTSHNIDRMFTHILQRVVASTAFDEAQSAQNETPAQREERMHREDELMRRTIRLASGKNPNDRRWFGCC
ncbi:hypothetical protein EX895_001239 [Sporisorium graminicola]|uniref:Uncharacterized protein n=1 Tax=Sporisorium graminicola TaxID=280036 RepID=A0A4U7KYK1_9BASI|nr:hypothetical protein EX895_001239 [Sporisorium graminicola]TKY89941.1 hypothetical protein EX895_001239 [Sporisorium graminicola]